MISLDIINWVPEVIHSIHFVALHIFYLFLLTPPATSSAFLVKKNGGPDDGKLYAMKVMNIAHVMLFTGSEDSLIRERKVCAKNVCLNICFFSMHSISLKLSDIGSSQVRNTFCDWTSICLSGKQLAILRYR